MSTKYVRKSGNDTTGDGSTGAPWLTIHHALNVAVGKVATGDTLKIGDGSYEENNGSGYLAIPNYASETTIESEDGVAADVVISAAAGSVLNVYAQGNNFHLKNLTLSGLTGKQAAIHIEGSNHRYTGCVFTIASDAAVKYSVLFAVPAAPTVQTNITFTNCTMNYTGALLATAFQAGGQAGRKVDGITMSGCVLTATQAGMNLGNGEADSVANVSITSTSITLAGANVSDGLLLNGVTSVTLTTVTISSTYYGLRIGTGNNAVNNTIAVNGGTISSTHATAQSILVNGAIGVTLTNVTSSGVAAAAFFNRGTSLVVSGGSFLSVNSYGMCVGTDSPGGPEVTGSITGAYIRSEQSHAILIGYGAANYTLANSQVMAGDYGLVIKHNSGTAVAGCSLLGSGKATWSALLFKGATNASVTNSEIVAMTGDAIRANLGDGGVQNANCTVTGCKVIVLDAANVFGWPAANDGGGCTVDSNVYCLWGSGGYGVVQADGDVATLAELQAAWAGYGVAGGDLHSRDVSMTTDGWTEADRQQIRHALGLAGTKAATSGGVVDAIKVQTDQLGFSGGDVRATLDGEAVALGAAERAAVADAVLGRDVAGIEDAAALHSLSFAVLAMSQANTADHPGMLTVYKTDGLREFARKPLRTAIQADAITGID